MELVKCVRTSVLAVSAVLLMGSANNLTRPKALEILKESVESTLPKRHASIRIDIWIPEPDVDNKTERILARRFLEAVQEKGFLSGPTTRPHKLVWTPGTDYFFRRVQHPELDDSGSGLTVVTSKGTVVEVTGIVLDGNDAEVDCEVVYTPTVTFETINSIVESYRRQGQRWLNNYLFSRWPEAHHIHTKQVNRYYFRRYDDGWRVERLLGVSSVEIVSQEALPEVPPPVQGAALRPSRQKLEWEVPSLGVYSDGYYQLELWRDETENGQVVGMISVFPEDVSQNPIVADLKDVSGNAQDGPLHFRFRLASDEVTFDGSVRSDSLEGKLISTTTSEAEETVFSRLESQYDKSYKAKSEWSTSMAKLLACCAPGQSVTSNSPKELKLKTPESRVAEGQDSDRNEQDESDISGNWVGEWSDSDGYLYSLKMSLFLKGVVQVEGQMEWILKISPRPREQVKIGRSGIEYVRGSYDARTQSVVLEGYDKHDPHNVIGLAHYELTISEKVLNGKTKPSNGGAWHGRFTATKVKSLGR